jgi:TRAP-type C4-dicarboxylate transport system permease small subunit
MGAPAGRPARSMVRRALDGLYGSAAALAAVCMVALLGMVLLSIAGRQLGFNIAGSDAYAGYFMAGAGFLALAHTLKRGEHIRVTLVLGRLREPWRRRLEVFALAASALLAVLFAWYGCRLAWVSYQLHDISTSADATPLWLPQLSMAAGTVVLAAACLDELLLELAGARSAALVHGEEPLRNE